VRKETIVLFKKWIYFIVFVGVRYFNIIVRFMNCLFTIENNAKIACEAG